MNHSKATFLSNLLLIGSLLILSFIILMGFGWVYCHQTQTAVAAPLSVNLIRNGWALGFNNDTCPSTHNPLVESAAEGWSFNVGPNDVPFITLSKCAAGGKMNPHPDGGSDGAAFKCGPLTTNGQCIPGKWGEMWQDYNLADYGILSGDVTVSTMIELISVGEENDFRAEVHTSQDGITYEYAGTLIDDPDGYCGTSVWICSKGR